MHLCTYTSHRLRCYLHTSLFCSWLYPRSQHGWLNPWSTAGTCLQDRIQDIPLANPLGKSPWNHDIPSDKILMYWNHGFSHGKTHGFPRSSHETMRFFRIFPIFQGVLLAQRQGRAGVGGLRLGRYGLPFSGLPGDSWWWRGGWVGWNKNHI